MSESQLHFREAMRAHLAHDGDLSSTRIRNPGQFHYLGISDFILREGEFFEPRPLPAGIDNLEKEHCYKNAFWTALQENLVYVEGYAVAGPHSRPLLHAWNLDRDGFVLDTTWNPHGRLYLGVIFPLALIPRKRGTQWAVIDDWKHGYPILRKPWDKNAGKREAFGDVKEAEQPSPPMIEKFGGRLVEE